MVPHSAIGPAATATSKCVKKGSIRLPSRDFASDSGKFGVTVI